MKVDRVLKPTLLILVGLTVGIALYFHFQRLNHVAIGDGPSFPESHVIRILPLGDSITHGASGHDSWRRDLYRRLVLARYRIDFVGSMDQVWPCKPHLNEDFDTNHEGHWGWRIDEIINGRDEEDCTGSGHLRHWLTNYTPDLVLLHLGSNDAFQKQSVESSIQELKEVIDLLRDDNPRVVIFLAQLIPTADLRHNVGIEDLNLAIGEKAKEWNAASSPVILVNHAFDFDPLRLTYDGVHPNEAGEAVMSANWYRAIVDFLESK